MMNDNFALSLPKMLTGNELMKEMAVLPFYDPKIRTGSKSERLLALSDIYDVYLPSYMSVEIYSKLYIALMRSLQKKSTIQATIQQIENRKRMLGMTSSGIIGGADSMTIIGVSGIGKSAAIGRSMALMSKDGIIRTVKPYAQIVPYLIVQCPFDSSVKSLLIDILRNLDTRINSDYCSQSIINKVTTDTLIGVVSQAALNHIGLLIVDEIQNVVNGKNGRNLVGALTQLINNSGISVCMVGTPESSMFFEQAMHLARRSLGLNYERLEYGSFFEQLCETLLSYNYLRSDIQITSELLTWLYEHSGGITLVRDIDKYFKSEIQRMQRRDSSMTSRKLDSSESKVYEFRIGDERLLLSARKCSVNNREFALPSNSTYAACVVAMFLGITSDELVRMKIRNTSDG